MQLHIYPPPQCIRPSSSDQSRWRVRNWNLENNQNVPHPPQTKCAKKTKCTKRGVCLFFTELWVSWCFRGFCMRVGKKPSRIAVAQELSVVTFLRSQTKGLVFFLQQRSSSMPSRAFVVLQNHDPMSLRPITDPQPVLDLARPCLQSTVKAHGRFDDAEVDYFLVMFFCRDHCHSVERSPFGFTKLRKEEHTTSQQMFVNSVAFWACAVSIAPSSPLRCHCSAFDCLVTRRSVCLDGHPRWYFCSTEIKVVLHIVRFDQLFFMGCDASKNAVVRGLNVTLLAVSYG